MVEAVGKLPVVIPKAEAVAVRLAELFRESVTVTTRVKVPAFVSEPLTVPLALTERPGNPETVHVYGTLPPDALKVPATVPPATTLPRLAGPEMSSGGNATLSVSAAVAVRADFLSVTVNVTLPLKLTVGVPLSVPPASSPSPSGSPVADHAKSPEPPVAARLTGP